MPRWTTQRVRPRRPSLAGLFAAALVTFGITQLTWAGMASAAPVVQPCSASYIGVPGSGQTSTSSAEMFEIGAFAGAAAMHAGQPLRHSTILSYPAVPFYHYQSPTLSVNLTGLDTSETTGQAKLTTLIKTYRAEAASAGCANAPILLAGYSQGAEVVIRTVNALPANVRATITVALLGDPSFSPGVTGDLDFNPSTYRGMRPSFSNGNRWELSTDVLVSRTLDICAASDPICAYHLSVAASLAPPYHSAHYHYTALSYSGVTLTNYAGDYLWGHRVPASPGGSAPTVGSGRILISPCLNLRAGANGNTRLVGCIPVNTTIGIDCTAQGNAVTGPYGTETIWDHTSYNGTAGYVADAWVYTGKNGPVAPACGAAQPTGRILIAPCLNLRAGPNGNTRLVGCIPQNTMINIQCTAQGNAVTGPYGTETIWDRTTYNGTTGFVADAWVYTGTNSAAAPSC